MADLRFESATGYSFDYELNQNELTGNTTLYRVNTGGSGVSGNVNITPDLSSFAVNPQAFFSAIPPLFWYIAAAIAVLGLILWKRKT